MHGYQCALAIKWGNVCSVTGRIDCMYQHFGHDRAVMQLLKVSEPVVCTHWHIPSISLFQLSDLLQTYSYLLYIASACIHIE